MIKGFKVNIRSIRKDIPSTMFISSAYAKDSTEAEKYVREYMDLKFTDYAESTAFKIKNTEVVA